MGEFKSQFESKGDLAACLARMRRGVSFRSEVMDRAALSPDFSQPLRDAVSLFNELDIGYALIGGVATMFYGRPRFTEDIDFVAASGHMDMLKQHAESMKLNHFDPDCVWKLYHESGVEIDIWKDELADGIISRAVSTDLSGLLVKVVEPHDLIMMKLRAGRLRDDYDISEIARGTPIDEQVIRDGVSAEDFERFLEILRRR